MLRINRTILAIALGAGSIAPTLNATDLTSKAGSVFIMTNAADKNEIIAYDRDSEGRLYSGDRYATGGRGSGGITDPLVSQGSLTLSQDHSLLFAANAGSGNISVFRVRRNALSLVEKVPSGGSQPVAIAQWQNLVYVLNSGGSGSVVAFRLSSNGQLKQIHQSTKYLTANGSGGASLTISPNGKFLVVTERIPNNVDTFRINSDGTLAPIVVNSSTGPGAFAAIFDPSSNVIVSETGAANAMNGSAVSSYTVRPDGTLSVVSRSLPTLGAANCWNAVTPDGKWVYVSNAATSTISGFAIGNGGILTPISGTVVGTNPQGSTNLDIAISADGKFLYSLNSGTGNLSIFGIQPDGSLKNLGDAGDLPKSSGFNGIAAL